MQPLDFLLERENANDEDATIVAVHVESGSAVSKGTRIVDVETSKAVQEIEAPTDGVVLHGLANGMKVQFGVPIFTIGPVHSRLTAPVSLVENATPGMRTTAPVGKRAGPIRVTARAKVLASAENVNLATLGSSFVTIEHVRRHLNRDKPAPSVAAASVAVPMEGDAPLGPRKRREIEYLSRGAGATMLSIVSQDVGVVRRANPENDFFSDKIVDLVVYEASRLMASHPLLNASYVSGDGCRRYKQVTAGVAFDDGSGLMVYGIRNSATLPLTAIQDEFLVGLEKYVSGTLSSVDLSSATFSITDLSGNGIDFVLPLLPQHQSSIIGITRGRDKHYRLHLGFDHRLTEGREAALFLGELSGRVRSFAADAADANTVCDFCGKSLEAELALNGGKGFLKLAGSGGEGHMCCRTCFGGW